MPYYYKRYLVHSNENLPHGTAHRHKIQRTDDTESDNNLNCAMESECSTIESNHSLYDEKHSTIQDNNMENLNEEEDEDWNKSFFSELENNENHDYQQPNAEFQNLDEFMKSEAFSEPIKTFVTATRGEIFLMILKFCMINSLSVTGMKNLFKLINSIFDFPILPDSQYIIDKLLNDKKKVEFHAICHNCQDYLGEFSRVQSTKACNNCTEKIDLSNPSNSSFFVLIDPSNQIADLLNIYENYYNYILNERVSEINCIKDVYDGKAYQEFVKSLSEKDKRNYVSAVFNTDGASKFKSSNNSIWPLYLMINELPPQIRCNKLIVSGLWFHKKKPEMPVFLNKFVNLINNVTNNGIFCTILGQKRNIKLHILSCCVDSVARAPVQGIKQFNGKFGCSWCLHPGKYEYGSMRYPAIVADSRKHDETIKLMLEADTIRVNVPITGTASITGTSYKIFKKICGN